MAAHPRGIYVCIEGLDGSGKSTLFKAITERMQACGHPFTTICPTRASHPDGWLERLYKKWAFAQSSSAIRAFIYAARSAQACAKTKWDTPLVLGDRSVVTSYVTRWRRWFNSPLLSRLVVDLLERSAPGPDHIIYLTAPIPVLRQRLAQRGAPLDIDETSERAVQMGIAYDELRTTVCIPRLRKSTWHLIDASKAPEAVADDVWQLLMKIDPAMMAMGTAQRPCEVS